MVKVLAYRMFSFSFVLLLAGAAPLSAQPTVEALIPADSLLHKLDQQLQLTGDQRSQAVPIINDHVKEVEALIRSLEGKSRLAMLSMRGKMKRIVKATDKRLLPLLSEAQRKRYDGFWDDVRDAQRKRMKDG
ncbi:MAG: hypothetical protein RhofKO_22680 [Rhodothermales bacterium]